MTSLCRRVILSYFGLPWETKLDLPDNYFPMFSKTLLLIAEHFNLLRKKEKDSRVAFILNVDEVNCIASNDADSSQEMIKELMIALRNQCISDSIFGGKHFFIPLVALTSFAELVKGLDGSGVLYTCPCHF